MIYLSADSQTQPYAQPYLWGSYRNGPG